jgi:hypothetical protein
MIADTSELYLETEITAIEILRNLSDTMVHLGIQVIGAMYEARPVSGQVTQKAEDIVSETV